jgi:periplasmic protein TonB
MPVTGADPGPAGAFMADALAGHALSVDLSVPAGAAPPEYTLAAGRRPVRTKAQTDIPPFFAAIAALFLHLTAIALIIVLILLGPSHERGTEEGLPENVNVSVISQAELDRLHSSAARQDQRARPGPLGPAETPPTATQAVLAPPQPAAQKAGAAPSSPQPRATARRVPSFNPPAFAAMEATASGSVRSARPGATHLGQSDEFERAVIWALGATVPEENGEGEITIVTFTVSASGQPDRLRLLKSSGNNRLDAAALRAVKQARIPSPPPGLPAGDRTFEFEYVWSPDPGG